MKRFIVILFILGGSIATSQDIPKKVNTIIITSQKSFKQVASLLLSEGYSISNSDQSIGLLKTDNESVQGWQYFLSINVMDSVITITGKINMPSVSTQWSDIENKGMKGSPLKKSFVLMDKFALTLGGDVIYERR